MSRRLLCVGTVLLLISLILTGCFGGKAGNKGKPYIASGRVTDSNGNGVEGILISLNGQKNSVVETDGEGTWQAEVTGEVTVMPTGHAFDRPSAIVTQSSPTADFVLLEDSQSVVEELNVLVEDSSVTSIVLAIPDAPIIEISKGTLPQGTKVRYQVVEHMGPTVWADGSKVVGQPVRLILETSEQGVGLGQSLEFSVKGQEDRVDLVGVFNGYYWTYYEPKSDNSSRYFEISQLFSSFAEADALAQSAERVQLEIILFERADDGEFSNAASLGGMELYKWAGFFRKATLEDWASYTDLFGGDNVVLLIHGFNNSKDDMEKLAEFFHKKNKQVFVIDYSYAKKANDVGIDALATEMREILANTKSSYGITIVAHSMGGLVSRAAVQSSGNDRYVSTLVTLGTPHLGVPPSIGTMGEIFGSRRQGMQLSTGSAFLEALNRNNGGNIDYFLYAGGNRLLYPHTWYTTPIYLLESNDGLVARKSAHYDGRTLGRSTTRRTFSNLTHSDLRTADSVLNQLTNDLKLGDYQVRVNVYDEKTGQQIASGLTITLDGRTTGSVGVQGLHVFSSVFPGQHKLVVQASGYKTQTRSFTVTNSDVSFSIYLSKEATVTPPSAPAAPKNLKAERVSDTSARISWSAVSGATSYEVQYSHPTNINWKTAQDYKNKTATSFVITALTKADAYRFRVRAVNAGGKSPWVECYYTRVTAPQAPVITKHPQAQTVRQGDAATFSVSATSPDGGLLAYLWRVHSTTDGKNYTFPDIGRESTLKFVPDLDLSGYELSCEVVNVLNGQKSQPVYSNRAKLTVMPRREPVRPTITSQPKTPLYVTVNETFTITVQAVANDIGKLSYAWFTSTDGVRWNQSIGHTSNSMNAFYITPGERLIKCVVSNTLDGQTVSVESNVVRVVVSNVGPEIPVIDQQPEAQTAIFGELAIFNVKASVDKGMLVYRWQSSRDNENWQDIPGASGSSMVLEAKEEVWIRCIVTSHLEGEHSEEAVSKAVKLTVDKPRVKIILPTPDNDFSNPISVNNESLIQILILGSLEVVESVAVFVDDSLGNLYRPERILTVFYPENLTLGEHTLTVGLFSLDDELLSADSVIFYWEDYRDGFGLGRYK